MFTPRFISASSSRLSSSTSLTTLAKNIAPRSAKRFSSSTPADARTPIGRIIPKRIAIQLPPGSGRNGSGIPKPSILQPALFCLVVGGGGFILAAQYTNADTQKWTEKLGAGKWWRRGQSVPTDREIVRAKTLEGAKAAQQTANSIPTTLSFLPQILVVPILRIYVTTQEYILNTPPAEIAPLEIVSYMGVVFLAWKMRRLEPFMRKWFLHRPVSLGGTRNRFAESVTLLTSVFSHQSLPHFAFNSIALSSFGAAAYSFLASPPVGTERLPTSTHTPHFLAFFVAAGLASSLASHLWTNLVRLPRLVKSINHPARLSSPQALAVHQAILPSLGASGAIYAALTLTACAYPETSVGLIFVPFISFPIGMGVAGMVTLDLIGLIRGWRLFDHVAHLGGALFGVVYYQYGREFYLWLRKELGSLERGNE